MAFSETASGGIITQFSTNDSNLDKEPAEYYTAIKDQPQLPGNFTEILMDVTILLCTQDYLIIPGRKYWQIIYLIRS